MSVCCIRKACRGRRRKRARQHKYLSLRIEYLPSTSRNKFSRMLANFLFCCCYLSLFFFLSLCRVSLVLSMDCTHTQNCIPVMAYFMQWPRTHTDSHQTHAMHTLKRIVIISVFFLCLLCVCLIMFMCSSVDSVSQLHATMFPLPFFKTLLFSYSLFLISLIFTMLIPIDIYIVCVFVYACCMCLSLV